MSPKYMVIYNNSCVTIAKSKVKVTTQSMATCIHWPSKIYINWPIVCVSI
jgi:hypothetical protein